MVLSLWVEELTLSQSLMSRSVSWCVQVNCLPIPAWWRKVRTESLLEFTLNFTELKSKPSILESVICDSFCECYCCVVLDQSISVSILLYSKTKTIPASHMTWIAALCGINCVISQTEEKKDFGFEMLPGRGIQGMRCWHLDGLIEIGQYTMLPAAQISKRSGSAQSLCVR